MTEDPLRVGVDTIIGAGLAPNPHLAPVSTGRRVVIQGGWALGAPGSRRRALLSRPPPHFAGGSREGEGHSLRPTDLLTDRAGPRRDPRPLRCQGRPESAGLRPEAGLAAAAGTNWRVVIGQRIVFHLRLQIPLRVRLSPWLRPLTSGKARGVWGEAAGRPWPSAWGFRGCSLEARGTVSGTWASGL